MRIATKPATDSDLDRDRLRPNPQVERDFLAKEAKSMSAPSRGAKVERAGEARRARGLYPPRPDGLLRKSRFDAACRRTQTFYGSRSMTFDLNEEVREVNRKRVQRLMRLMGSKGWSRGLACTTPRHILSAARHGDHGTEPRLGVRHHAGGALARYGKPRISGPIKVLNSPAPRSPAS